MTKGVNFLTLFSLSTWSDWGG